jgi:hypothetical protein
MNPEPSLEETIAFMKHCHEGQMDKSGKPYWTHPLRVMLRLGPKAPESAKKAALLHDVVEDCGVTLPQLRSMGYSMSTVRVVDALTRRKDETYRKFIDRTISRGLAPCAVKLADLADNSSPGRVNGLPEEMKSIVKRYEEAKEKIFANYPVMVEFHIIVGDIDPELTKPFGF